VLDCKIEREIPPAPLAKESRFKVGNGILFHVVKKNDVLTYCIEGEKKWSEPRV
jgi:hypothetical protein